MEHNEHVPAYLLGKRKLPPHPPELVGWGDQREAFTPAMISMARKSSHSLELSMEGYAPYQVQLTRSTSG